jgi:hypothetical protein
MKKGEPPPLSGRSESSLFLVGQDSRGNWVVQDVRGRRGGLFLDRAHALKFARFENGGDAATVIMMKAPFELDMRPLWRITGERQQIARSLERAALHSVTALALS